MNIGKMVSLGVLSVLVMALLAGVSFAAKCSDGTWGGYCSTVNPGKVCDTSGTLYNFEQAPDRMYILQKDTRAFTDCKCPAGTSMDLTPTGTDGIPTFKCKSTSCTENGVTTQNGSCVSNNKPKMCVNGELVDRASSCKCPDTADVVGDTCRSKTGCIVNQPACETGYTCNTSTNSCQKKQGCAYDNPSCATSNGVDYECDSGSNTCVKKAGCLYDNPTCASDKKCVSNQCVSKDAPPAVVTPEGGSTTTADTGTQAPSGKLLCCPLISVFLLGLLGIFALIPRKQ